MNFDFAHPADWAANAPWYGAAFIVGYLLGSIPFGLLFAWLAGAGDVRKIGSGNIGATNVLRTGKRWAAVATLVCDAAKGALAVFLCGYWGRDMAMLGALGAFIGHIFPVWLGFKGGKGVATALGILLTLYWPAGIAAAATWIAMAAIFRISSLSALVAALLAPVYMALFGQPDFAVLAALLALIVFFTHRENIRRLTNGTEPRIGGSKAAA